MEIGTGNMKITNLAPFEKKPEIMNSITCIISLEYILQLLNSSSPLP